MEQRAIAWQVSARMTAKDISKEELSELSGVNKRTLYLIMTGRQKFTLTLIEKIAKGLKCSIPELLSSIPEEYL